MIYELRVYTCRAGSVGTVLELWEAEGRAVLDQYLTLAGQWTAESGDVNRIFTLWQFEDLEQRRPARASLLRHPGFADYLARCREHYLAQEAVFLAPTPLSPLA